MRGYAVHLLICASVVSGVSFTLNFFWNYGTKKISQLRKNYFTAPELNSTDRKNHVSSYTLKIA